MLRGHAVDGNDAIETRGLTKRYGSDVLAVDQLNLRVRRGEVYGFLGPNGAGKTTTLKMLLGLVKPSSGTGRVFDEEPGAPAGLARVGALVEAPAFYPYLSGRDNLETVARYSGEKATKARVNEVLGQVGLQERAGSKFKKYSLGMKQRLGIAAALLKEPELLILDEPTNGLDPSGMVEMRDLVRLLNRQGRTIFVSSHLLGEVEQVCDRVGVIRKGRLVAEGRVDELKAGLLVRAEPLDTVAWLAEKIQGVERATVENGAVWLMTDPGRAGEIERKLTSAGVRVSELRPTARTLEEIFLRLTEDEA